MAYVAINKDGTELKFDIRPNRFGYIWKAITKPIILPKGTIEKLIGRKLTWRNEPIEIEIKIKNK